MSKYEGKSLHIPIVYLNGWLENGINNDTLIKENDTISQWHKIVDITANHMAIFGVDAEGTVHISISESRRDAFNECFGDQLDTLLNTKVGAYKGE